MLIAAQAVEADVHAPGIQSQRAGSCEAFCWVTEAVSYIEFNITVSALKLRRFRRFIAASRIAFRDCPRNAGIGSRNRPSALFGYRATPRKAFAQKHSLGRSRLLFETARPNFGGIW